GATPTVAKVTFQGFDNLQGGAGKDLFKMTSAFGGTTIDGGAAVNTVSAPAASSFTNSWIINGTNSGTLLSQTATSSGTLTFANIQNLTGGAGVDTFAFTDGGSVDGIIDGGTGANVLDFSGRTVNPVTVAMQPTTATGLTANFKNIKTVHGSSS